MGWNDRRPEDRPGFTEIGECRGRPPSPTLPPQTPRGKGASFVSAPAEVLGLAPSTGMGAFRSAAVQSPAALSPRPPRPQAGEGENSTVLRLFWARANRLAQSAQADFVTFQLRFQPPGSGTRVRTATDGALKPLNHRAGDNSNGEIRTTDRAGRRIILP